MRITDGDNPLDATSVHPESYGAAEQLLEKLGLSMDDLKELQKKEAVKPAKTASQSKPKKQEKKVVIRNTNTAMGKALAAAMGGVSLAQDADTKSAPAQKQETAVNGLERRVKDKKKMAQELGIGEITLKDLKPGMILKGTVRNVIDFGVFVDIGVHQDGLVHISQITDKYIKHPLEAVSVGDIVDVKVMDVDLTKKRISLTMRIDK